MLTRTRKAFTLLELMVAFVIMAILAAVAIPSLQSIVSNSQNQANQSTALNIAHAAYFNAQSVYPAGTVGIGATSDSPANLSDLIDQANTNGQYNTTSGPITAIAAGTSIANVDALFTFSNGAQQCVTFGTGNSTTWTYNTPSYPASASLTGC